MRAIIVAAALTAITVTTPSTADEIEQRYELNIARQPLDSALKELASQTGLQIARFVEPVDAGRMGGPINGKLSAADALKSLLAPHGLSYKVVNDRTIAIVAPDVAVSGPRLKKTSTSAPAAPSLVLALAERDLAQGEKSGNPESLQKVEQQKSGESSSDASTKGIPEILVTGSRAVNTDARRTEDDIQPYVVFDAEEIRNSMAGSLQEFLSQRLTMNTTVGSDAQEISNGRFVGTTGYGDRSTLNLRGLGADETLILVNGRRRPGFAGGLSGDAGQADLNGIPLSSIKRIEVLPATAGGIYGGNATGGVINVILRDDYDGVEASVQYQNAFDTDVGTQRYTLTGATSLEGGKTRIDVTLSRNEANALDVGDRDFAARSRALLLAANPAAIYSPVAAPPVGRTTNIRSNNGAPLELKVGSGNRSLGSLYAHVPYGYAGPASDNGAALRATAGTYNLDIPDGLQGRGRSLIQNPRRQSVTLSVRRSFTDHLEMFVDSSFNETRSLSRVNNLTSSSFGSTVSFTLPSTAPNNPFTQAVTVTFPASDYDYASLRVQESSQLSLTGGAIVRLPGKWSAQGEFSWGRSTGDYAYTSIGVTSAIFSPPAGQATPFASGALNVMRDVTVYPLDYSPYLRTPTPTDYSIDPRRNDIRTYSLRTGGPLLVLPGGPLAMSALVERRESVTPLQRIALLQGLTGEQGFADAPRGRQDTDSYYVEFTAPLFSATNGFAGLRALEMQASYRYDSVRTEAASQDARVAPPTTVSGNQYTVGLSYQPVEALALRVSYGAGIRPPRQVELDPLDFPLGITATDALRGGLEVGVTPVHTVNGFPGLRPEKSGSWSVGLILRPAFLSGLRVSVDYTRIEKTDEIATVADQLLLDRETDFPGRIVRNPLTDTDRQLGYQAGSIREFYGGFANLARTEVEAFDMNLDYGWDTAFGAFRANALATWSPHYTVQTIPTVAGVDSIGFRDGALEWRGDAGLTWERNAWTVGWNMQYYHGFLAYTSTASPASRQTTVLNQGSARIPRQTYHDLFVKFRTEDNAAFAGGLLGNSEFQIGISNVLDELPPTFATLNVLGGTYSTLGDPRLRRYTLSVRKSFGGR